MKFALGGEDKRTVLRQMGLVFALMLVLLLGLAAWEMAPRGGAPEPAAKAKAAPDVPVQAPGGELALAPVPDTPSALAEPPAQPEAPPVVAADTPSQAVPAEPGDVTSAPAVKGAEEAPKAAQAEAPASAPASPTAAACPAPEPVPACPPAPAPIVKYVSSGAHRPPVPPQGKGYMLQLGVFGAPENADRLQADLSAKGVPAYVESRVVLGPYKSAGEAEAARSKLGREGRGALVVAPRRSGK